ncbi:MAG: phage tail protein [Lachnospiraceae bacterium]|nr:phage tail protein [Lachnospiraceae bacterium]
MIYYQVEMENLTEIEAALGMMKDKSKMVLRTAINNTAKETVTLLVDEVSREYYYKKSDARKTITTKKATTSSLQAIINSSGPVNELYDFKVNPKAYRPKNRPKADHKGNVRRDRDPSYLYLKPGASRDKYKAFVVKYSSGHITIAQRVPGQRMKSDPSKEAIKTLLSPSVPNMLGYEQGVYGIVNPQMYDLLQKNIQEQIQRYLG